MATEVQFRRYDTTTISSLTGLEGEVFVDLNKDTLVVQDGSTAGGFPLQHELVSGTNIKTINNVDLLASGNLDVQEVLVSGTNIKTIDLVDSNGTTATSILGSGGLEVQNVLVSGTNIKTVNGNNLLGGGNIDLETILSFASNTLTYTDIDGGVVSYQVQEELVSGTNIKTVNGNNLLGAGDIDLATSISLVGNELRYTDIDGNTTTIDLTLYLDDTNLARLVSGTLDGVTGVATFTRDDASTFTVDFGAFFDDTNLARITSGSVAGSTLTLSRNDATTIDIDVSSLLDNTNLVTSVAGRTGDVTLTESDITDLGSYVPLSGDTMTGNLHFGDDVKATFGDATTPDLQIYHDSASNSSWIMDYGAGHLEIGTFNGPKITLSSISGTMAEFNNGGSVDLYYNASPAEIKLATTSTGVDVTGTITTDGLSIGTQVFPASDGTTDQLLSTDGAGTLSWVDAPSGGSWDLLATSTLNNATEAELTAFDSTKYSNYVFVFNIKASSGAGNELEMQIADTSNSTLSIKAVRYTEDSNGNNKVGTTGQWAPIAGDNNIEDISGAHGIVYLFNAHDASGTFGRVHYKAESSHGDATTLTPFMTRAAGFFSGGAVSVGYVRFALDSANMEGIIKMYGIKN